MQVFLSLRYSFDLAIDWNTKISGLPCNLYQSMANAVNSLVRNSSIGVQSTPISSRLMNQFIRYSHGTNSFWTYWGIYIGNGWFWPFSILRKLQFLSAPTSKCHLQGCQCQRQRHFQISPADLSKFSEWGLLSYIFKQVDDLKKVIRFGRDWNHSKTKHSRIHGRNRAKWLWNQVFGQAQLTHIEISRFTWINQKCFSNICGPLRSIDLVPAARTLEWN